MIGINWNWQKFDIHFSIDVCAWKFLDTPTWHCHLLIMNTLNKRGKFYANSINLFIWAFELFNKFSEIISINISSIHRFTFHLQVYEKFHPPTQFVFILHAPRSNWTNLYFNCKGSEWAFIIDKRVCLVLTFNNNR